MSAHANSGEPQPLLTIENLEVRFGDDPPAVRDASVTVYAGQTVAVVGESGSGKSTMAAAVLGLLPPGGRVTGGRILFAGNDITHADPRRIRGIRGRQIGLVPQDPLSNLNPVWTVGFQIREALRVNGMTKRQALAERAVALLDEAGMTDSADKSRRYPHQLSGGMCQRALIAIGLAGRPRLLIADEPTSALDVTVQRQVLDHLEGLASQLGTAVLLITHDLALAVERAEHLVVMYRGAVVESGPAAEIVEDPRHAYTHRLVAAAPALTARTRAPSATPAEVDHLLVVSELSKVFRVSAGTPWRRRDVHAADKVSFTVRRGKTTAVVGESGSGKTTVARMVLGLLVPTSGSVAFDGRDVATLNRTEMQKFRRRVQPVFQNPYRSLDPMYSVHRIVEEPLRIHGVGDRVERRRRVRELIDQVALPSTVLGRYPRELSGGQRQRIAIARALALHPDLLVCDEAVSALDVIVAAQILELLAQLQSELGLTYLFISHDLAVVRQIADDVVVMSAGKVVEQAATEEVFTRPGDPYTRRLLDAIPSVGQFRRAEARSARLSAPRTQMEEQV